MLRPTNKYALLSLTTERVARSLPENLELGDGLSICRKLPLEVPEHWRTWIGSLAAEEIEQDADLILIMQAPDKNLEILDSVNKRLCVDLNRFYLSLLITAPAIGHRDALRLSGSVLEDGPDVRQFTPYPQVNQVGGTERWRIEETHIRQAMEVYKGIVALQATGMHSRVWRAIRALHAGMVSPDIGNRLHQAVRCLDGLFAAETRLSEAFKSRGQLFVGTSGRSFLETIWSARCKVEHLDDVLSSDGVKGLGTNERHWVLTMAAIQAEFVARDSLCRVLSKKDLWPHFANDNAVRQFWDLPGQQQAVLWGDAIELRQVANTVDMDALKRACTPRD